MTEKSVNVGIVEVRKPDAVFSKLAPEARPRADVNYFPSQFTLSFEHRGKKYVFHTLTKQLIEGVLPLSARAGEGCDDLIKAQYLVPEDRDECAYYNSVSSLMRAYNLRKGTSGYTILPTTACNARCVYCFEEGMKPVTMTPEVVEQTIRYMVDTCVGKKAGIYWFGGEPLLCPHIIDRICAGLSEAGVEYEAKMITNGSLVTPEIVEKMSAAWKLNFVQISMDGAEADYIFRKNYRSYQDCYHKAIEAARQIASTGIHVDIRCNVDEENWDRVPEFLSDLTACISDRKRIGVYFSPLYGLRNSENDLTMWRKIKDARHLIKEAGFYPTSFLSPDLRFRVFRCMADSKGVTIGPDGSLYPCDHCLPETRFGDVFNGTTNEAARKEFCRVDRTREKCRTCAFLPDCTSLASCPVQDFHCREAREMMALDMLKRIADKTESKKTDGEVPVC